MFSVLSSYVLFGSSVWCVAYRLYMSMTVNLVEICWSPNCNTLLLILCECFEFRYLDLGTYFVDTAHEIYQSSLRMAP